jgi:hypothetical protein
VSVIADLVRAAISTAVSKRLCNEVLRCSAEHVMTQFDSYMMRAAPKRDGEQYSASQFCEEMNALGDGGFKQLAQWVKRISCIVASEASAERVFRRLKLTVASDQKQMLSTTSEARVKINILSQHFLDARNQAANGTRPQRPIEVPTDEPAANAPQQDDAATLAAIGKQQRENFYWGAHFIMLQAHARIEEEKQTRTQQRKAGVLRCSAATCGKILNGTNHANPERALCCGACGLWFAADCINVNFQQVERQGRLESWQCTVCEQRGTAPHFW